MQTIRAFRRFSSEANIAALMARIDSLEREVATLRPQMPTAALGATGLNVSRVSLGCAPLGGVYGGMDLPKAQSIVDFCLANGINLFDTSPYYGDTRSETVLGQCLRDSGASRDS